MKPITVSPWAPYAAESCDRRGAIMRHGPHHDAQKSTSTTLPRSAPMLAGSEPDTATAPFHVGAKVPSLSRRSTSSAPGKATSDAVTLRSTPARRIFMLSGFPGPISATRAMSWLTSPMVTPSATRM